MSNRLEEVKQAYRDILCREGDSAGVESYVASGKRVDEIRRRLRESTEYKKNIAPYFKKIKESEAKHKILLFGAFGNGNLGDAIQADFVSKGLLEAGFNGDIWATSFLKNHYNFSFGSKLPSWAIKSKELLENFDMILVGGGGLLSHPHYPLNDRSWAESLPTKLSIISVGATNFAVNESHSLIQRAVSVSARDKVSYQCLRQIREGVSYVKDPVFSMQDLVENKYKKAEKTMWVLKGPLESVHYEIRKCVAENDIVVGFEKSVDCDIEGLFPEIVYVPTIDSFNKLALQCEKFFSMRYHGLIAALAHSDNVFAIGDPKNRLLLEEVGMTERYLSEEGLFESLKDFSVTSRKNTEVIEKSRRDFIKHLEYVISII